MGPLSLDYSTASGRKRTRFGHERPGRKDGKEEPKTR